MYSKFGGYQSTQKAECPQAITLEANQEGEM